MRRLGRIVVGLGLIIGLIVVNALAPSVQASAVSAGQGTVRVAGSAPGYSTKTVVLGPAGGTSRLATADITFQIIPRWSRIVYLLGPQAEIVDMARHRVIARLPIPTYGPSIVRDDAHGRIFVVESGTSDTPATIESIDVRSGRLLSRHQIASGYTFYLAVDPSTGNLIGVVPNSYGGAIPGEVRIVSPDGRIIARHPFSDMPTMTYTNGPVSLLDLPHHALLFCKPAANDFGGPIVPGDKNPTTIAAYDTRTGARIWEHSVGFPPALCAVNATTGQVWAVALGGHVRIYDDRSGRLVTEISMTYPTPGGWENGRNDSSAQLSLTIDDAANVGYISSEAQIDRADPRTHQRRILRQDTPSSSSRLGIDRPFITMLGIAGSGKLVYNFDDHTVAIDGRSGTRLGRWPGAVLGGLLGSGQDSSHVYDVYPGVAPPQTNDISAPVPVFALRIDTISL
jgi:hypothetical protein